MALGLSAVCLAAPQPSKADLIFEFAQVGPDVVLSSSGSFAQLGIPQVVGFESFVGAGLVPVAAGVYQGPLISIPFTIDAYLFNPSGADGLGPGPGGFPLVEATASSGGFYTFVGGTLGEDGYIELETGYSPGTPLSGSLSFANSTFQSLGLTPGEYIWTMVGAEEEKVIIRIPGAAAGVPGPVPLLAAGAAFGWSRRLRHRARATLPSVLG